MATQRTTVTPNHIRIAKLEAEIDWQRRINEKMEHALRVIGVYVLRLSEERNDSMPGAEPLSGKAAK
jgi:hypothetical protein